MATPFVRYGQDGLSAFDSNGVRRIWLDPISTSLSFYDSAGVRRIWLDALGVLLSFFDANAIARCQIGNLPANGVSAAHFGFRVNDATGNPIYDSQGVIQHTSSLGFLAAASSSTAATANISTWADLAGTSFTFTIANRPQQIRYEFYVAAKTTGAGGTVAYIRGSIVGFDNTASPIFDKGNTGWTNAYMWYFVGPGAAFTTIPVGTYTVKLQGATDSGQTLQLTQFFHQVSQFGA